MSDDDQPAKPVEVRKAAATRGRTFVDAGVPAVMAHGLGHVSADKYGSVVLTFVEERADLNDPQQLTRTVCARIAMPRRALEEALKALQAALAAKPDSAPSAGTLN